LDCFGRPSAPGSWIVVSKLCAPQFRARAAAGADGGACIGIFLPGAAPFAAAAASKVATPVSKKQPLIILFRVAARA
jgi:hypothetical protein